MRITGRILGEEDLDQVGDRLVLCRECRRLIRLDLNCVSLSILCVSRRSRSLLYRVSAFHQIDGVAFSVGLYR